MEKETLFSRALLFELSILLAAAVLMSYVLLFKPIVGIADNGDFRRVMASTGLDYPVMAGSDKYFSYVNREYRLIPYSPRIDGYFTTAILPIEAAKALNRLFSTSKATFDIRFLAAVYIVLMLFSIHLIFTLRKGLGTMAFGALILLIPLVFMDTGALSYFNSFYSEAASYTFLLLTLTSGIALCSHRTPSIRLLILFFSALIILSGAKFQNLPIGMLGAILAVRMAFLRKDAWWRSICGGLSALLLLTFLLPYSGIPDIYRICNKYQSVFYGVLKDSPTPERDLKALGMDPNLAVLANTNYFMASYPIDIKSPQFSAEIDRKVNSMKIAVFYVKHPKRLLMKLQAAASASFSGARYLGNLEKDAGAVGIDKTKGIFGLWSRLKESVLPHSLPLIAAFFISYFFVLAIFHRKYRTRTGKLRIEIFAFLGMIGLTQFIIPIIGDGEADLSKHLFLFNACFDVMLVIGTVWLVQGISRYVYTSKQWKQQTAK